MPRTWVHRVVVYWDEAWTWGLHRAIGAGLEYGASVSILALDKPRICACESWTVV
jgi:hypothetical protein